MRAALPKATDTQVPRAARPIRPRGREGGDEGRRTARAARRRGCCWRSARATRRNLLILDEPTNHLDIDAREALVKALADFEGAVLLITHDPHLVELVADRLWLVGDGTVAPFDGDLDDYRALLAERARAANRDDARAVGRREGRRAARARRRARAARAAAPAAEGGREAARTARPGGRADREAAGRPRHLCEAQGRGHRLGHHPPRRHREGDGGAGRGMAGVVGTARRRVDCTPPVAATGPPDGR